MSIRLPERLSRKRKEPISYRPIGGIESTLNGAEIKKTYSIIRDVGEVLMNFKYLGKYFKVWKDEPNYDLMHDRMLRHECEQSYDAIIEHGEHLIKMLEWHLMGMKHSKNEQENGSAAPRYITDKLEQF